MCCVDRTCKVIRDKCVLNLGRVEPCDLFWKIFDRFIIGWRRVRKWRGWEIFFCFAKELSSFFESFFSFFLSFFFAFGFFFFRYIPWRDVAVTVLFFFYFLVQLMGRGPRRGDNNFEVRKLVRFYASFLIFLSLFFFFQFLGIKAINISFLISLHSNLLF